MRAWLLYAGRIPAPLATDPSGRFFGAIPRRARRRGPRGDFHPHGLLAFCLCKTGWSISTEPQPPGHDGQDNPSTTAVVQEHALMTVQFSESFPSRNVILIFRGAAPKMESAERRPNHAQNLSRPARQLSPISPAPSPSQDSDPRQSSTCDRVLAFEV